MPFPEKQRGYILSTAGGWYRNASRMERCRKKEIRRRNSTKEGKERRMKGKAMERTEQRRLMSNSAETLPSGWAEIKRRVT